VKKTVTSKSSKRIELETDIIADLEPTEAQTGAIVGGANYTRAGGIATVNL